MKNQFFVQPSVSVSSQFQKQRKLQSQGYERKSRQSSRQGHSNPLKVKNSFLRQSLTFQNINHNNQANLYNKDQHNVNNSQRRDFVGMKICQSSQLSHNNNGLVLQSDKKHDFMIKKIVEKYSNNVSPTKGYKMEVNQKDFLDYQNLNHAINNKEKQVIRLSGRKADNVVTMSVNNQSKSSKENNLIHKVPIVIDANSSQLLKENQKSILMNQKTSRLSNGSTAQSIICDSSLANFVNQTNNLNQSDSNVVPISQFQDQFNLLLKRLVKNQCEIQTLKRNKQCSYSQLQTLWVQFAKNQQKIKVIQKRQNKFEEKILQIQKSILSFKDDMKVINKSQSQIDFQEQFKKIRVEIEKRMKQRESLFQKVKQDFKSTNDNTLEKIRKQFQTNYFQKLKSLFLDTASNTASIKVKQTQRLGLGHGYKISQSKKCHDHIKIVYQEVMKVSKSNLNNNSVYHNNDKINDTYISSDRSKLLANALNLNLNLNNMQYRSNYNNNNNLQKKRQNFSTSMPVSPQNSKSQHQNSKQSSFNFTTKQLNFNKIDKIDNNNKNSPLNSLPTTTDNIQINQVKYFIDMQGFLLDQKLFYLLDENDQYIKIDEVMLEVLKINGVISNNNKVEG